MKSTMVHDFSRIPSTNSRRSSFDRGHGLKTAFDSGNLVPLEVQEVLPGDEVKFDAAFLGRTAPLVTPIMDNVFFDVHAFFVPSRLIWTNFTKMMGEQVNPKDSIDYLVPQIESGKSGFGVGSLADFFGIPTQVPNLKVNALPFRAYAKIWDDWYRDQNLQDSIIQSSTDLDDAGGSIAWNTLLKRGKRHDYFTSALPWTQKGEAITLPLGSQAPVYGDNNPLLVESLNRYAIGGVKLGTASTRDLVSAPNTASGASISAGDSLGYITKATSHDLDRTSGLYADLSMASAATVNAVRTAFQLQVALEQAARSGTRYCEIIRSVFHTVCPDARLQRSEYLGGVSQLINMLPTAQTSATSNDATPQGNLVANGKVQARLQFTKSFTEHGYIIVLGNVRCDLNYQNGLSRMWSRRGRFDFFTPALENLGEQAVLNKEIFAQGEAVKDPVTNEIVDDQPFGYQERYAEYRYNPSIITGKMRSSAPQTLDVWHLAQNFTELPKLNAEFIQDNPPLKRVLAVTDEPEFILDAYLGQVWTRPMGTYSIPGLVDHL